MRSRGPPPERLKMGIGNRNTSRGASRKGWRESIHRFREAANSLCAESAAHVDESLKSESKIKCEELRHIYLELLELDNSAVPDALGAGDTWRDAMKCFDDVAVDLDRAAEREATKPLDGKAKQAAEDFAEIAKGLANEVRDILRGLRELLVRSPKPPPSLAERSEAGAAKAESAADRAEAAAEKAEAAAKKATG
jgi:hypothetical protein